MYINKPHTSNADTHYPTRAHTSADIVVTFNTGIRVIGHYIDDRITVAPS